MKISVQPVQDQSPSACVLRCVLTAVGRYTSETIAVDPDQRDEPLARVKSKKSKIGCKLAKVKRKGRVLHHRSTRPTRDPLDTSCASSPRIISVVAQESLFCRIA
ncbi:hypothetical protein PMIN03_002814 [Paraphaeosphaeria minitans]